MFEFARTRTRDDSVKMYVTYTGESFPGGVRTPFSGSVNTGFSGVVKTMRDYSHPNFRKVRDSGGVIISPMELTVWRRDVVPGFMKDGPYSDGYHAEEVGDWTAPVEQACGVVPPSISGDLPRMAEIALAKAYAKIKSSAVMGGELLHDLDKSISMLKQPFADTRSLVAKMMKAAERGRMLRPGRTAITGVKAIANAWLEQRYGWKPIILDTAAIIRECGLKRQACESVRLVARAEERQVKMSDGSFSVLLTSPWNDGRLAKGTVHTEQTVRACAGVIFDLKSQNAFMDLQKSLGLRASDFPATLWEVIPYSFVVDWFTNVGDWIQAVTPVPGVSIQGNWVTTIDETVRRYSGGSIERPIAQYVDLGTWGASVVTSTKVLRTTNNQLTFTPVLTAKALSMLHAADAMALTLQSVMGAIKGLRH